ncbi:uncharacterized protein LOC124542808 [Vanessa cardui]|uniref:uncharacterized protein LOC124542808 n=1 Tax=Vanessa cardui TaxID=171605 RepID=UPI001F12EEE1|nr:uncharacterized protein LOC124542808 [Vanessa cardui]
MPIGKIEPFSVESQNWDSYVRRLKQFITLNSIDDGLKVATLLTLVGGECYNLLCDLCSPDHPEDKDFDELVELLKHYLEPEKSEIAERHIFRQRTQLQGESIRLYLQGLKHLAKTCYFGSNLEENLRDQFVSGLYSEEMRSRIFAEKDIDYKRAVELASALEAAERHASTAGAPVGGEGAGVDAVHWVSGGGAAARARARMSGAGRSGGAGGAAASNGGGDRVADGRVPCARCGRATHTPIVLKREYPEVFAEGLGTFKSCIRLHLNDKKPVFVKARPLPLSLRERVEAELERLQREGVIYKVDRSDYGTPTVPVIKSNGDIRICGDYKIIFTLNPILKDFHYPLPRIEEIFSILSGGELYTKLDLSSAFQQCLLHEEYQAMTAITTHVGTFVYRRVPFGIKCIPENFQKIMEETLNVLKNHLRLKVVLPYHFDVLA